MLQRTMVLFRMIVYWMKLAEQSPVFTQKLWEYIVSVLKVLLEIVFGGCVHRTV